MKKILIASLILSVSLIAFDGCMTKGEKTTRQQKAVDLAKKREDQVFTQVTDAAGKIADEAKGSAYGTTKAIHLGLESTNDAPTSFKAFSLAGIFSEQTELLLGPPNVETAQKYREMVADYTSQNIEQQKKFDTAFASKNADIIGLQADKQALEGQLRTEIAARKDAEDRRDRQAAMDAADASQWRGLQAKNFFMKIASVVGPLGLTAAVFFFPALAPIAGRLSGAMAKFFTPKAVGFFGVAPAGTLDNLISTTANFKQKLASIAEHNKTIPNAADKVSLDPEKLLALYAQEYQSATDSHDRDIIDHREANTADVNTAPPSVASIIGQTASLAGTVLDK